MAVTASYDSHRYLSAGVALPTEPVRSNLGIPYSIRCYLTVATTEVDNAGDILWLCPLPCGTEILGFDITSPAFDSHATPTLNADLVLRIYTAGVASDTVVYDSSGLPAPVSAARVWSTAKVGEKYQLPAPVKVAISDNNMGHLIFYVNTAAATAAGGILIVDVWVR